MTNFLSSIGRKEDYGCPIDTKLVPKLNTYEEMAASEKDKESSDCIEDFKLDVMDQAWIEWKDFDLIDEMRHFFYCDFYFGVFVYYVKVKSFKELCTSLKRRKYGIENNVLFCSFDYNFFSNGNNVNKIAFR